MKIKTLTVSKTPSLHINNIPGDLRLTGWEQSDIKAKTNGKELELVEKDGKLTLSCDNDLILSVPKAAQINIKKIKGDASLRNLSGSLELKQVNGDLALRNIGEAKLGEIGGDLVLRHGKGDFQLGQAHGDASIRDLMGNLQAGSFDGDFHLREIQGSLNAKTGGDAILFLTPIEETEYTLNASGDILLRLPQDTDAELTLSAGGDVSLNLPNINEDEEPSTLILGSASAKMTLSAGGDLLVTTQSDEWESLADFDIGLPFIGADLPGVPADLADQISKKVEAATRKAMLKTGKAGRKARKAGRQARKEAKKVNFFAHFSDGDGHIKPASEDERLLILKMLQEKKITAEEAEKLLAALG
ncbi:MAG: DUF4097 family beta strand repeat protein [Anaerolineae bacterium]|jgi:hypothetical protein|nr:DUF4097 family beta strand repeat protein [Anaerolineae bacterium]MBT4311221.1 DUF4097 family beta strand repeat protein [Anaerolineae bacterium]MBT4459274.1 DUF4097 family beta strand repeat protein [Anaerolineae bacterium]MBT4841300.1 DUF4097 family beta strand repeat protein [Anaerolineae bacterium]MBT6061016.1 DUF4097 family beta strand repeat protein [Anaerolineae bacterium]